MSTWLFILMTGIPIVYGGGESRVVLDLILQKSGFSLGKGCHVITFDLSPMFLMDLLDVLDGKYPLYHYQSNATNLRPAFERLHSDTWCVFGVATAQSDQKTMEDFVQDVAQRRIIYLSSSPQESESINTQATQVPSYVAELSAQPEALAFWIHVACPNCAIPFHTQVDHWQEGRGFLVRSLNNYFDRCCFGQTELFGKVLNVSVIGVTPYIAFDPETRSLSGIDIDMLRILAEKFRFKPNVVPERTWGAVINGSWIGTVGSVQFGKSAFGIGHVSITYDRYQIIDYTTPTYFVEYAHISHVPKVLNQFQNLVTPFDVFVWLWVLGTLGVGGLAFYLIFWTYSDMSHYVALLIPPHIWVDYLIMPLSMFLTQDRVKWFQKLDKVSAGQFMVLNWSVCGVFISLAYLSNLRASLIAVAYERPIDYDWQIVEKGDPVYYVKGTSLIGGLQTSPLKVHNQLYALAQKHGTFYEYDGGSLPWVALDPVFKSGKGSVLATRHAFDDAKKDFVQKYGEKSFRINRSNTLTVYAGIVVPKNALWKPAMNSLIERLNEMGIFDYMFKKSIPLRFENEKNGVAIKFPDNPQALKLITILSPLLLLGILHLCALLTFTLETCCRRKTRLQEALKDQRFVNVRSNYYG